MNTSHDHELLNSHAMGILSDEEARAVEIHLVECPPCREQWQQMRETADLFADVEPATFADFEPATFVDGPPNDDLALQRALRQIRAESGRAPRGSSPRMKVVAAVAAAAAVALAGGVVVERIMDTPPPQTVVAEGSVTGIEMSAEVAAVAADAVEVTAAVQGLPPGERCELVVTAADGTQHVAADWVTGAPDSGGSASRVAGPVTIALDQVRTVAVRNDVGRTFITLPVQLAPGG